MVYTNGKYFHKSAGLQQVGRRIIHTYSPGRSLSPHPLPASSFSFPLNHRA